MNRVLDIAASMGIIETETDASDSTSTNSTTKRTQREHIIDKLVRTERTYVHHLELLQSFKELVNDREIVTSDAIHSIFSYLNALVDFQRRFLIRVEHMNVKPASEQNWGSLFILNMNALKMYEVYIANKKDCEDEAKRLFNKLRETDGTVEARQMTESPTHLISFLLKPFWRLATYPLLLKELRDKGNLDEQHREDISRAIEGVSAVFERVIVREELNEAVEELKDLVDDWKGHRIKEFGDLLLHGRFPVLRGESVNAIKEEVEVSLEPSSHKHIITATCLTVILAFYQSILLIYF